MVYLHHIYSIVYVIGTFISPIDAVYLPDHTIETNKLAFENVLEAVHQCFSSASFCVGPEDTILLLNKGECEQQAYTYVTPYETAQDFYWSILEKRKTIASTEPHVYVVHLKNTIKFNRNIKDDILERFDLELFNYVRCNKNEFAFMFGTEMQAKAILQSTRNNYESPFDTAFPLLDEMKLSPELQLDDQGEAMNIVKYNVLLAPTSGHQSIEARTIIAKRWERHLSTKFDTTASVLVHDKHDSLLSLHVDKAYARDARRVLTNSPETTWMEKKLENKLLNLDAAMLTQSGLTFDVDAGLIEPGDKTPFWSAGITGNDQIVGVADSGLDTQSCFFADTNMPLGRRTKGTVYNYEGHRKVIQYAAAVDGMEGELNGHGTHVCGSIAGSIESGTQMEDDLNVFRGAAPSAKLAFFDIGLPGDKGVYPPDILSDDLFKIAYDVGARIHSNSWGSGLNAYTFDSAEIDKFSYEHQDFVILVAAGNDGTKPESSIGSVGSQANAKNAISVGASMNSDHSFNLINQQCPYQHPPCNQNVAQFSSDGPTRDGRLKPDIIAPGHLVGSANSGKECGVFFSLGTSMATPIVAGTAVLAREYLMKGFYPSGFETIEDGFTPMGALIKAILINSGSYLKGTYSEYSLAQEPSSVQGFGMVQLNNTLPVHLNTREEEEERLKTQTPELENNVYLLGNFEDMRMLNDGETETFQFKFNQNSVHSLKITLVWYDPPAQLDSKTDLVNDLDLMLIATVDDEVFEILPSTLGGERAVDTKNNVEQIEIKPQDTVTPGVKNLFENGGQISVVVKGSRIPQGPQPFALVIKGGFSKDGAYVQRANGEEEYLFDSGTSFGVVFGVLAGVAVVAGLVFAVYVRSKKQHEDNTSVLSTKCVKQSKEDASREPVMTKNKTVRSIKDARSGMSSTFQSVKLVFEKAAKATNDAKNSLVPGPPEKLKLPKNWKTAFDESSQTVYYFNEDTGQVTWDRPT